jgi:hypothetical protein
MPNAISAITESKLLAKVIIQSGEQLEIVAIFEKSEYYKFFFVFTAKSPNDPQKKWTLKRNSAIFGMKLFDLDTFVAQEISFNFRGKMMVFTNTKLYCEPEFLRDFIHKVGHPLEGVRREIPHGATFDRVGRKRSGSWFNTRNKAFDSLPAPTNEVLVYEDFCAECGSRHNIPHFPSGTTKCMDYMKLNDHPGLEYTGRRSGMFVFRYRVSQAVR